MSANDVKGGRDLRVQQKGQKQYNFMYAVMGWWGAAARYTSG